MVRENSLGVNDLIWPVFVQEGDKLVTAIPSMPGVSCSLARSPDGLRPARAPLYHVAFCFYPSTNVPIEGGWGADVGWCKQMHH